MSSGRRGKARCQMGPGADGSLGGATEGRGPVLQGPRKRLRGLRAAGLGLDRGLSGLGTQDSGLNAWCRLEASVTPPIRIPKVKGERPGQFSLPVEASDPATG